jgi:hypothetical protein
MADSVTYTAMFSEAVTGVAASNFRARAEWHRGASIAGPPLGANVARDGQHGARNRDTCVSTSSMSQGIANIGGTPLGGAPVTGQTYQIDKGGTVVGSGEGQLVTGFGNGGYALFHRGPNPSVPGRIRVTWMAGFSWSEALVAPAT